MLFNKVPKLDFALANILSNKRKQRISKVNYHLPALQHSVELSQEKGASARLTSLLIDDHGFALHKSAFRDACHSMADLREQGGCDVTHASLCLIAGNPPGLQVTACSMLNGWLQVQCEGGFWSDQPYLRKRSNHNFSHSQERLCHTTAITDDGPILMWLRMVFGEAVSRRHY